MAPVIACVYPGLYAEACGYILEKPPNQMNTYKEGKYTYQVVVMEIYLYQ